MKKTKHKASKSIDNYIRKYWWLCILFFPLAVGGIYQLPLPQIIAVEPGELLSYYGVAFGLFGSYFKYSEDKRKENRERQHGLTPFFSVKIEKNSNISNVFKFHITPMNDALLRDVYLYDEFLCDYIKNKNEIDCTLGFGANMDKEKMC